MVGNLQYHWHCDSTWNPTAIFFGFRVHYTNDVSTVISNSYVAVNSIYLLLNTKKHVYNPNIFQLTPVTVEMITKHDKIKNKFRMVSCVIL